MGKKILTIVFVALLVILGVILVRRFQNTVRLPDGESEIAMIVINNDGNNSEPEVIEEEITSSEEIIKTTNPTQMVKEIMVTDGTKHSVPLNEIRGGGPPKDGIPPIDNPKFLLIPEVDFIDDEEPGVAVSLNGISRFYPFQIMVWHEIVNDTFDDKRVLVTYCPLCLSGIVFDPIVDGERVEFGTSGQLWNSNLVMYDRKTDSLWSQVLGEAIVGEMTGVSLRTLPSDQIRFKDFKAAYPDGQVLSKDTGATRIYGYDPYGDYYTTPGTFFPVNAEDDRLEDKDFVLGVVINGQAKAYHTEAVKRDKKVEEEFAGINIVAEYDEKIDAVRIFEKKSDGTLERINPFGNFWFSWVAAHPDTELYK